MTDYSQENILLYHHEQVPYQPMTETTMVLSDLENIIYNYQTEPELLKLILSSKLEEDKRRAEEAKLKAKQLDLLLLQQQEQQQIEIAPTFYADGNFTGSFVDHGDDQLLFHPMQPINSQYTEACDSLLSPSYTCSSDELLEDSSLFQSYPIMTSYEKEKVVDDFQYSGKEIIFDGYSDRKQQHYEFQHYDIKLQVDMVQNKKASKRK